MSSAVIRHRFGRQLGKFIVATALLAAGPTARAQAQTVEAPETLEERTTVTVKRELGRKLSDPPAGGVAADKKDFEIVEGTADVTGEPGLGRKAGQDNWKVACQRWRDDMERRNRGHHIVSLECNSPAYTIDQGQYVFKSTASYRIRMRTHAVDERRDETTTTAPSPTGSP
jgi:hypothetical protein